MKKVFALLILAGLCTAVFLSSPPRTQGKNDKLRKTQHKIENQYIVVLDDAAWASEAPSRSRRTSPTRWRTLTAANSNTFTKTRLMVLRLRCRLKTPKHLSQDYRVKFVEEDGVVTADITQSNPPWGLDRIDQRNRPLSATYTYNWTGSGVRAYVIDTGIRTTHTQFGGRASNVFDAFGGSGADCNGHGTHVSGTIGGSTYGVAKSALLRGVRVSTAMVPVRTQA